MGAYQLAKNSPLYLMGHRVYDAETARFLSRDPLGSNSRASLYGFALGNPYASSDPDGLNPPPPGPVTCATIETCPVIEMEGVDEIVFLPVSETTLPPTTLPPVMQGKFDVYSELLSWNTVSTLGTSLGGLMTSQTNPVGSALMAVDRSIDATTYEAIGDYDRADQAWRDAGGHLTSAVTQVPSEAAHFVYAGLASIPDSLDNAGAYLASSTALPFTQAIGTDQDVYELSRLQTESELKLSLDILTLLVGNAVLKRLGQPKVGMTSTTPKPTQALEGPVIIYTGVPKNSVKDFVRSMADPDGAFRPGGYRHDLRSGHYFGENRALAEYYAGPGGVVFEFRMGHLADDGFVDVAIQGLRRSGAPGAHRARFIQEMDEAGAVLGNTFTQGNKGTQISLAERAKHRIHSPELADFFEPNLVRGQLFPGRVPPGSQLHPLGLGFEYSHVQWRMRHPTLEFRQQIVEQATRMGLFE